MSVTDRVNLCTPCIEGRHDDCRRQGGGYCECRKHQRGGAMSHDPEAVEAIRDALAAVADGSGQEETVADALRDWLTDRADMFADALAAAGYTVTRSKYEPAVGGYVFAGNGRWMWTRGTPPNEPLYRKIEEDR